MNGSQDLSDTAREPLNNEGDDLAIDGLLRESVRCAEDQDERFVARLIDRVHQEDRRRGSMSSSLGHKDAAAPKWLFTRKRWLLVAACLALVAGFWGLNSWSARQGILTLIAADRGVKVIRAGGAEEAAKAGMLIFDFDLLQTPPNGRAKVQYGHAEAFEETILELMPGTKARFHTEDSAKRIELTRGTLDCTVARQPKGKEMVLSTPYTGARVVGTRFILDATSSMSWLWVREGKVELAQGPKALKTLQVTAGRAAVASATGLEPARGLVYAWGDGPPGLPGASAEMVRRHPEPVPGLADVQIVALSLVQTLALKADGSVWAWTHKAGGQVGDSADADPSRPAEVPGLVGVKAIAAGQYHSLALKKDGSVWAWGKNADGQLGDGTTADRLAPGPVRQSDGAPFTGVLAIAAWGRHSVALKTDHSVWAWGWNTDGMLGDGTTQDRHTPVPVRLSNGADLTGIAAIASGNRHTLARTTAGTVWAWGRDKYGQVGSGTKDKRDSRDVYWYVNPVQVRLADDALLDNVTAIAGGDRFSMALSTAGTPWFWGQKLAANSQDMAISPEPARRADGAVLSDITDIAAGNKQALALTRDGTVLFWNDHSKTPVQVTFADGTPLVEVTAIAAGFGQCAVVTNAP